MPELLADLFFVLVTLLAARSPWIELLPLHHFHHRFGEIFGSAGVLAKSGVSTSSCAYGPSTKQQSPKWFRMGIALFLRLISDATYRAVSHTCFLLLEPHPLRHGPVPLVATVCLIRILRAFCQLAGALLHQPADLILVLQVLYLLV